jgi:hypothetical protein
MKRFRITLLVCIFLASATLAPSAQQQRGAVRIGGTVSPATKLSLGRGWQSLISGSAAVALGLRVAVQTAEPNSVQINLSGSGLSAASQVVVPLEMRTNVAYELKLTLISSEGPTPLIFASIGLVRPSGTLVASRAAEVSRDENSIDLTRSLGPVTALHGRRISVGGNFTTPDNALLADLNLSISQNAATQGSWRALLRISLHKSP